MTRILKLWLCLIAILCFGSVLEAAKPEAKSIQMLGGSDAEGGLAQWTSFHEGEDTKTADVWSLDKDGVLSCKGTPLGYLVTKKEYTNFVLTLQWRWPPGKKPGKGGVLVRITGEDKIWPKSLEAQINAGDAGDFWGLAGYELTGPAERYKSLSHPKFGKLTNVKKIKPVEKEPGQWNSYKITADGGTVTLVINGQEVNKATGCDVVPGKICLTSEGHEIQFRDVVLTPK